jgi:hypothetical protein
VLAMSSSKVSLEVFQRIFLCFLIIQSTAGAHEIVCGKDLGITHVHLLRMNNYHSSCLRKVSPILNLLEEGLHRFLGVTSLAHLLKIIFSINSGDVAIGEEQVITHFPGCDVYKAYHVVVRNFQVHWLKKSDDFFS